MRAILPVATLMLLFFALSHSTLDAGDTPKDLLVGKWKVVDSKNNKLVEFTKDGKMIGSTTNTNGKVVMSTSTYKFIGDEKIEITVDVLGKKVMQTLAITSLTKDELVTKNDFGGTEKYKRVKK